jgi:hypothetical protein
MFRILTIPLSLALIGLALTPSLTSAQERTDRLAPVAHLLDAQTLAVARLDLAKIDVAELLKFAASLSPMEMPAEELQATTMKARSFLVL